MTNLLDYLDGLVYTGDECWGYQLSVAVDGVEVLSRARGVDGQHRALTASSTVAMYCASKTLLVAVTAMLVDEGVLAFDDCVGDLVPRARGRTADTTIDELLGHRAGIHRPTMFEAVTLSLAEQRRLAYDPTRDAMCRASTTYTLKRPRGLCWPTVLSRQPALLGLSK